MQFLKLFTFSFFISFNAHSNTNMIYSISKKSFHETTTFYVHELRGKTYIIKKINGAEQGEKRILINSASKEKILGIFESIFSKTQMPKNCQDGANGFQIKKLSPQLNISFCKDSVEANKIFDSVSLHFDVALISN